MCKFNVIHCKFDATFQGPSDHAAVKRKMPRRSMIKSSENWSSEAQWLRGANHLGSGRRARLSHRIDIWKILHKGVARTLRDQHAAGFGIGTHHI